MQGHKRATQAFSSSKSEARRLFCVLIKLSIRFASLALSTIIPILEQMGTVEKTKEAYKQEQVHLDEIARINRKLETLETRKEKKETEIVHRGDEIKQLQDVIPLGQPILVGHHSEKRHRKHLERIDNLQRKQNETFKDLEKIKSQIATAERQKAAMQGTSIQKQQIETPVEEPLKYAVFSQYDSYLGDYDKATAKRLVNEDPAKYIIEYRKKGELKEKSFRKYL